MQEIGSQPQRGRRSKAWVYYTLLTVGALLATPTRPAMLLAAGGFGLYARYIYRGGRFVIWFW